MYFVRVHFGTPDSFNKNFDEVKVFKDEDEFLVYMAELISNGWNIVNWRWYNTREDVEIWVDKKCVFRYETFSSHNIK